MATSKRPYLLRAINEWILDNMMTPHILVDATGDHVKVPKRHVEEGRIVLNISPDAVRDLAIGNDLLLCSARFGGKPCHISVPIRYVLAIYAKENGMGIVFPEEEDGPGQDPAGNSLDKAPHLKLVK